MSGGLTISNFSGTSKRRSLALLNISTSKRELGSSKLPAHTVVSALSTGFWVGLLGTSYAIHFQWRYCLTKIFPHEPQLLSHTAATTCRGLLNLRNRVAHHEPIFHLRLPDHNKDLRYLIGAMCPASLAYIDAIATFDTVWAARPT